MEGGQEYIHVKTSTDEFVLKGRPCELSAYSFVPTSRNTPKDKSVFNSVQEKERFPETTYDRVTHQRWDWDEMLHRCDREHAKSRGLNVNDEEKQKAVPSLSSSIYGHHLREQIDVPERKHARVALIKSEFYRHNGTNLEPS